MVISLLIIHHTSFVLNLLSFMRSFEITLEINTHPDQAVLHKVLGAHICTCKCKGNIAICIAWLSIILFSLNISCQRRCFKYFFLMATMTVQDCISQKHCMEPMVSMINLACDAFENLYKFIQ